MARIAVIQQAPVLLDREATLARAAQAASVAATDGARVVVFPEAYIPGYPAWIWRLRPGGDSALADTLYAKLFENAVDLARDDLSPLRDVARRHEITILCGVSEIDDHASRATLYNTVVTIGPDGTLLNRHRKVMPTNAERMVWGFGDASGLRVVDTPCGRVGALICWENYMPQARLALYAQGVEVYVAPTFDDGDGWVASMRHIAREGRCWVIASGVALQTCDIPDVFPEKQSVFPNPDEWVRPGGSVIVAPGGGLVAGPLRHEYGVLHAEIDLSLVAKGRRVCDVAGHYSRPDLFQLHINDAPQAPVIFASSADANAGNQPNECEF